jgi:hypothetical protein
VSDDTVTRATAAAAAMQQTAWELGATFWAGVADAQMRVLRLSRLWLDESLFELDRQEEWARDLTMRAARARDAGRDAGLALADAAERLRDPGELVRRVAVPIAREAGERAVYVAREIADRAFSFAVTRAAPKAA